MTTRIIPIVLLLLLALSAGGAAQGLPDPDADTGTLEPRRVVAGDTALSYALYLPPGHGPHRRWPALILMDPRGRALVPLERFRAAAARLGYVIVSSYDTSSDQPTSAGDTERAVEGLANDALARAALDPARLYLVGFSGTARLAWVMALAAPDHFPAVVGFGGGVPPAAALSLVASSRNPPAFFGGAGVEDFNYREMWSTARTLESYGVPHALRFFPGGHDWPPEPVAAEAVAWIETLAQRTGLAAMDTAWLTASLRTRVEHARALHRTGRLHDARAAYAGVVARFGALSFLPAAALDSARDALRALEAERVVRETDEALAEWLVWEDATRERIGEVLARLDEGRIPSLRRLSDRLDLDDLHEQAARPDTLAAQAARRQLAGLYAHASFYRPRLYLERADTLRALRALELAHRVIPEAPTACLRFLALPEPARARSERLQGACRPASSSDRPQTARRRSGRLPPDPGRR